MNMLHVVNFNELVINDYDFAHPLRNVGNSYIAKTQLPNHQRYVIQLPKLRTPEGIIFIDKKEYLTLEFDEMHEDVLEFFSNVDEYCIKYVSDNSSQWFEVEYDVASIEKSFEPIIKSTENSTYVTRLRIPPNVRDTLCVFDENKNKMGLEDIIPGVHLIVLIELEGLRFLRTQVIPIWNLLQCKMYKELEDSNLHLTDYLILDEGESTDSEDEGDNTTNESEDDENEDINADESGQNKPVQENLNEDQVKNVEIDDHFSDSIEIL